MIITLYKQWLINTQNPVWLHIQLLLTKRTCHWRKSNFDNR